VVREGDLDGIHQQLERIFVDRLQQQDSHLSCSTFLRAFPIPLIPTHLLIPFVLLHARLTESRNLGRDRHRML
jgi:hypothetical protein